MTGWIKSPSAIAWSKNTASNATTRVAQSVIGDVWCTQPACGEPTGASRRSKCHERPQPGLRAESPGRHAGAGLLADAGRAGVHRPLPRAARAETAERPGDSRRGNRSAAISRVALSFARARGHWRLRAGAGRTRQPVRARPGRDRAGPAALFRDRHAAGPTATIRSRQCAS